MNTFAKLVRQFALSLTLVATLAGSGVVARGEGSGVGSGGYPPPVMGAETLVAYNTSVALYSQGSRLYSNGVIVYSDGTTGKLP